MKVSIYVFNKDKCQYEIDDWNKNFARVGPGITPSRPKNAISPQDHQWNHYFEPIDIHTSVFQSLNWCYQYDLFPVNCDWESQFKKSTRIYGAYPHKVLQEIFEVDEDFLFRDITGYFYSWTSMKEREDMFTKHSPYIQSGSRFITNLDLILNRMNKFKQLNIC